MSDGRGGHTGKPHTSSCFEALERARLLNETSEALRLLSTLLGPPLPVCVGHAASELSLPVGQSAGGHGRLFKLLARTLECSHVYASEFS